MHSDVLTIKMGHFWSEKIYKMHEKMTESYLYNH